MRVVLQAHHVQRGFGTVTHVGDVALVDDGKATRRQQPFGLQLLAAQTDDHHFTAEVGVQADVAQCADRHHRVRRFDGHAAAVAMLQRDDIVDVGEARQQLGLDALHREVGDPGHALHRLRDGQDVARAHRAVGIAVALERVALQRRQRGWLDGGDRQALQAARIGHLQQPFVHPAAGRDVLQRMADGDAVALHRRVGCDVDQRHLVALRHAVAQHQARGQHAACGQASVVGHDGNVVALVHADRQRGVGHHLLLTAVRRLRRWPRSRHGPGRSGSGPGRGGWAPACGHRGFPAVR